MLIRMKPFAALSLPAPEGDHLDKPIGQKFIETSGMFPLFTGISPPFLSVPTHVNDSCSRDLCENHCLY